MIQTQEDRELDAVVAQYEAELYVQVCDRDIYVVGVPRMCILETELG